MNNILYNLRSVRDMMTSSNGNIFRVIGPFCGEFTGQRWIPFTKASDAETSSISSRFSGITLYREMKYLSIYLSLMFSLICAWINGWANNREAGDLRHHRAHYDVIVMIRDSILQNTEAWMHVIGWIMMTSRHDTLSAFLFGESVRGIHPLHLDTRHKNAELWWFRCYWSGLTIEPTATNIGWWIEAF